AVHRGLAEEAMSPVPKRWLAMMAVSCRSAESEAGFSLSHRRPPPGVGVRARELPWLLLPVFGLRARYCEVFCVAAHSLFRENNRAYLIGLRPLLQKLPAQQRKILNSDSISWNQCQIYFDRVVNPPG